MFFNRDFVILAKEFKSKLNNIKEEILFEEFSIWKEKISAIQGSYLVIFLSFSDVNGDTFSSVKDKIVGIMINLYAKFIFLQQSETLDLKEKEYLNYTNKKMSDTDI